MCNLGARRRRVSRSSLLYSERQDHGQQVKKRGEMSSSLHVPRAVAHLFPHCFFGDKETKKKKKRMNHKRRESFREKAASLKAKHNGLPCVLSCARHKVRAGSKCRRRECFHDRFSCPFRYDLNLSLTGSKTTHKKRQAEEKTSKSRECRMLSPRALFFFSFQQICFSSFFLFILPLFPGRTWTAGVRLGVALVRASLAILFNAAIVLSFCFLNEWMYRFQRHKDDRCLTVNRFFML